MAVHQQKLLMHCKFGRLTLAAPPQKYVGDRIVQKDSETADSFYTFKTQSLHFFCIRDYSFASDDFVLALCYLFNWMLSELFSSTLSTRELM